MPNPQTTPNEVQKVAARRLLMHLKQYENLGCEEAVRDVMRFASMIYKAARQHEREDNYGVSNQN